MKPPSPPRFPSATVPAREGGEPKNAGGNEQIHRHDHRPVSQRIFPEEFPGLEKPSTALWPWLSAKEGRRQDFRALLRPFFSGFVTLQVRFLFHKEKIPEGDNDCGDPFHENDDDAQRVAICNITSKGWVLHSAPADSWSTPDVARGNRQEFGDSLDESEKESFDCGHGASEAPMIQKKRRGFN